MSKLTYKLIIAITVCTITVAIIVGGFSLYRSAHFISEEVDEKLQMGAEKYAKELSAIYNRTEGVVDGLATNVEITFDGEKLASDDTYFPKYKEDLGVLIKQTLKEIDVAQGLYLTFDPTLHEKNDEVWYAREDDKIVYINASTATHERDFSMPAKEDMMYFFKPIFEKKGSWTGPYFDRDIKKNIVSYSRAVYYKDTLIGVVGADVLAGDTTDTVSAMNIYEGGYSFLLDENLNVISHPTFEVGEPLLTENPKELQVVVDAISSESSGVLSYGLKGEEKILGFSQLDNGWILAITQLKSVAYAPIKSLMSIMAVLGLVILLVTLVFAWFFSTAFSKPIVLEKEGLLEQNREKDIMLAYQSRQAKVGEMIGNITHQWKQPLNSINLILANILDAYRYGELDEAKLVKSVDKADNIVKKLVETVKDFTNFLKPSKEKSVFDVSDQILEAISLMETSLSQNDIKMVYEKNHSLSSFGYPNEFAHVVFNVLNNARDAILEDDLAKREIHIDAKPLDDSIDINIFNFGPHILTENLERIFEPYFTTKNEDEGTGLGLYICRIIVEQRMKGSIDICNVEGGVCCNIKINKRIDARAEAILERNKWIK